MLHAIRYVPIFLSDTLNIHKREINKVVTAPPLAFMASAFLRTSNSFLAFTR